MDGVEYLAKDIESRKDYLNHNMRDSHEIEALTDGGEVIEEELYEQEIEETDLTGVYAALTALSGGLTPVSYSAGAEIGLNEYSGILVAVPFAAATVALTKQTLDEYRGSPDWKEVEEEHLEE